MCSIDPSKAAVLLLIAAPIVGISVCSMFYWAFLCLLFLFCNHLGGDKIAGCFTLFVILVTCNCYCSVAVPRGSVGWPVVCDCYFS